MKSFLKKPAPDWGLNDLLKSALKKYLCCESRNQQQLKTDKLRGIVRMQLSFFKVCTCNSLRYVSPTKVNVK